MGRYTRQIDLFGYEKHQLLRNAKVLVVGAGGLGNICAKFLASSGVGSIVIADHDHVELSNLNRQIMFNDDSIDVNKAEALCGTLEKVNPDIRASWYDIRIQDTEEIEKGEYDVIIDCTDNMETSYFLESIAIDSDIPLVFAKTSKWFGTVGIIRKSPYLRKSYPKKQLNKNNAVFPCIGGIVGSYQAGLAIKLILGLKTTDDIIYIDSLNDKITTYEKTHKVW